MFARKGIWRIKEEIFATFPPNLYLWAFSIIAKKT
jgi:hypothetical protein